MKTGRQLQPLDWDGKSVLSVAVSPDGRRVAAAGRGPFACVWDVTTRRRLFKLKGHHGVTIRSIGFSADGKRIITASSDTTAKLWEATTGSELLTLKGHADFVEVLVSATMSADGLQIATAGEAHTIRVWRAATPEQIADWQKEEELGEQL